MWSQVEEGEEGREKLVLRVTQQSGMELTLLAAGADELLEWKLALCEATKVRDDPGDAAGGLQLQSIEDDPESEEEAAPEAAAADVD